MIAKNIISSDLTSDEFYHSAKFLYPGLKKVFFSKFLLCRSHFCIASTSVISLLKCTRLLLQVKQKYMSEANDCLQLPQKLLPSCLYFIIFYLYCYTDWLNIDTFCFVGGIGKVGLENKRINFFSNSGAGRINSIVLSFKLFFHAALNLFIL